MDPDGKSRSVKAWLVFAMVIVFSAMAVVGIANYYAREMAEEIGRAIAAPFKVLTSRALNNHK